MALFKPKQSSSGGGNKFTGICETHIVGFKDRSAEFDWADVFIEVEVGIKDSEYTRNIRIRGSFDKDENGNITGGSVINRMYKFFGDIGCVAGITVQGKWELEDGTAIDSIEGYLEKNHVGNNSTFPYLSYVYKEENKKSGKTFNSVHYRLFPNTSKGNTDLASHIQWMKTNGYLKEATPQQAPVETTFNEIAKEML